MKYFLMSLSLLFLISVVTLAAKNTETVTFWYNLDEHGSAKMEELITRYNKEKKGKAVVQPKKFSTMAELK